MLLGRFAKYQPAAPSCLAGGPSSSLPLQLGSASPQVPLRHIRIPVNLVEMPPARRRRLQYSWLLSADGEWRSIGYANRLLFGVGAALGLSPAHSEHMDSRVILGGPALQLQQIAIYFTWPLETPSSPRAEIYNILYLKSGLLYSAGMLTAKALMEC